VVLADEGDGREMPHEGDEEGCASQSK